MQWEGEGGKRRLAKKKRGERRSIKKRGFRHQQERELKLLKKMGRQYY